MKKLIKEIRKLYRLYKYGGDNFLCPFCNNKSKDFMKIGLNHPAIVQNEIIGAGVRNGGCVKCESSDRERKVYAYLKHIANVFKDNNNYSILHFAPEHMLSKEFKKYEFKEYVCADKFMMGYQYPDYTVNMDIMQIPYPNEYFDLIICNHVLEHIPDDFAAMKELFRVLKKGGFAILQVPISNKLEKTYENPDVINGKQREEHYGQFDHLRIYGKDYAEKLESAGFIVERINISDEYVKYGLIPEEDIFIGNK